MPTSMEWYRDVEGDLVFSGKVSKYDLMDLKLDRFDRAVLSDCSGDDALAHDWLLALELVFRRMHQQRLAKRGTT